MVKNADMVVDSHPAVLNGFINQTRRYIEQEKELAAQAAEKITIDGQECIKVDEWGAEEETYVLGNSVTDKQFFYAEVMVFHLSMIISHSGEKSRKIISTRWRKGI